MDKDMKICMQDKGIIHTCQNIKVWSSRVAPRGYVQSTKGLTCRMHKHMGKWEHIIYECKGMWGAWTCEHRK